MFRGRGRRFRRRWETDTVIQCANVFDLAQNQPCCKQTFAPFCDPVIDAFPLLTMTIPFTAAPERYPSTLATRKMIFGGMKFQSDWWVNPQEWSGDGCPGFGGGLANVNWVQKIWEAIVVLPLQQGSTFAPDYLPVLACASQQSGDLADRVLWKRVTMLPCWGFDIVQVLPQLEINQRNTEAGPQVVKVRAAVDDRHGIFMVRQFVNDIVWQNDCGLGDCTVPLHNELYGKLYYRAR